MRSFSMYPMGWFVADFIIDTAENYGTKMLVAECGGSAAGSMPNCLIRRQQTNSYDSLTIEGSW